MKSFEKSFTMMELCVVLVIVGVLATIAVTQYGAAREQAFDREARANLLLIQTAERVYALDNGGAFYDDDDEIDMNNELGLSLTTTNMIWDYSMEVDNVAVPPEFCIQATRVAGGRTWRIRNTEEDPVEGGVCP